MTSHEIFIKFIEHNVPTFSEQFPHTSEDLYLFCNYTPCDTCPLWISCSKNNNYPVIHKTVMMKYKKEHPENCI